METPKGGCNFALVGYARPGLRVLLAASTWTEVVSTASDLLHRCVMLLHQGGSTVILGAQASRSSRSLQSSHPFTLLLRRTV